MDFSKYKKEIDIIGKLMGFIAGYLLVDMLLLPEADITPDFIEPVAGILVGIGGGILAMRLVK